MTEYTCTYCGKKVEPPLAYHEGECPRDGASATMVGGDHYLKKVQPWDAMAAWMSPEQFQGFLLGSAIAYLGRFNTTAPGKGGITDVRKARHYCDKLIEVCEANQPPSVPKTREELITSARVKLTMEERLAMGFAG